MLLEDIQENGFKYFRKAVYKDPNQLELFDEQMKITNLRKIKIVDNIIFWINLLTAILFIYLAYDLNRPISMTIGWLLLIGWMLGAYERRLLAIRRKYRRERREKELEHK